MRHTIFVGYDTPHADAFAVCRYSLARRASVELAIHGVQLDAVRKRGLYWRPTTRRPNGDLWDDISEHAMSTEFAISRFLTPYLAGHQGWAIFMDCDILALSDIARMLALLDPQYAVMCVKHAYAPADGVKMDGKTQTAYARKNWSSVMAFNCEHLANQALTLDMINTVPGRDLHRFCWLRDGEIGELPGEWNWLAGHSAETISPALVHYTRGGPWLSGFDAVPFAKEWLGERALWIEDGATC